MNSNRLAIFLCLLSMVLTACITYGPSSSASQTEVEKALNNLHDLNATQKEVTFELVDIRNRLLSMPKDSPPTRDLIRQLAILNKRATEMALELHRADLEYQAAVKADIEATLLREKERASPTQATLATVPEVPPSVAATSVANSNMRKVIANRLTESKQTIPHFYLSIDCIIDNLLEVRSDLNSRSTIYKLSINDFVIRASALALRKVPAAKPELR